MLFVLLAASLPVLAQTPPSPRASSASWIESILGKMTLEEKIDYIGGTGFAIRAMPERPISVSTQPGQTALTVIFLGASSRARARVRPMTPCLDVV